VPVNGHRRTPGLRREEVSQLAGVGLSWYTWLEQGRDITPSSSVLDALARVLNLDVAERTHLFDLAGVSLPPSDDDYTRHAPAGLRRLEDALDLQDDRMSLRKRHASRCTGKTPLTTADARVTVPSHAVAYCRCAFGNAPPGYGLAVLRRSSLSTPTRLHSKVQLGEA
jgi:transcriptional regulator with XRE-family HTH domain